MSHRMGVKRYARSGDLGDNTYPLQGCQILLKTYFTYLCVNLGITRIVHITHKLQMYVCGGGEGMDGQSANFTTEWKIGDYILKVKLLTQK